MTKPKPAEKSVHKVEVRNPRYAGATPEMVARALLKAKPQPRKPPQGKRAAVRSSI